MSEHLLDNIDFLRNYFMFNPDISIFKSAEEKICNIVLPENSKNNLDIKKVIFNKPAVIVFWKDGTKTIVKAQGDEPYDKEKGLAMAIAKKALGNKGNYWNVFKAFIEEA